MKTFRRILLVIAVLLSDIMCAHVAYLYRDTVCGMNHMGYSAPPGVAFLAAIPYLIGIALCVTVALILRKKAKK